MLGLDVRRRVTGRKYKSCLPTAKHTQIYFALSSPHIAMKWNHVSARTKVHSNCMHCTLYTVRNVRLYVILILVPSREISRYVLFLCK